MKNGLLRFQFWILLTGIVLMCIKFLAWYFSHSNAILTDALESIVNVLAAGFTLYSFYFAVKPKDKEHPYGHGKIEFIAAGIEGGLIGIAGLIMMVKSSNDFFASNNIHQLDFGIILVTIAGTINYLLGYFMVKKGKSVRSMALVAGGRHLQSDGYTSAGLIIGLLVVYLSQILWLDNVVAILLGLILIFSCISIIRKSIGGIMDEADMELVEDVIKSLKENRSINWIDIHNLRVIKYGDSLHIDCHVTLPWYLNLQEAHDEMDKIQLAVEKNMETKVEFFIHNDPCLPKSCTICRISDCKVRKNDFVKEIEWNLDNLITNQKHNIIPINVIK